MKRGTFFPDTLYFQANCALKLYYIKRDGVYIFIPCEHALHACEYRIYVTPRCLYHNFYKVCRVSIKKYPFN